MNGTRHKRRTAAPTYVKQGKQRAATDQTEVEIGLLRVHVYALYMDIDRPGNSTPFSQIAPARG